MGQRLFFWVKNLKRKHSCLWMSMTLKYVKRNGKLAKHMEISPWEREKTSELVGAEAYFNINQVLGKLEESHGGKRIKSLFFRMCQRAYTSRNLCVCREGISQ